MKSENGLPPNTGSHISIQISRNGVGYQRSIELSHEYGLYRQDYCGCVFSRRERDARVAAQENGNS